MTALPTRRVVITGIGIVSPLGTNRESTWSALIDGLHGAAQISAFDASTWPSTVSCEVKNFSLTDASMRDDLRPYLNRASAFGVEAAREALEDADLIAHLIHMKSEEIAVSVGANMGAITPRELQSIQNGDGKSESMTHQFYAPAVLRNHPGTLAALLSQQWQACGSLTTVQTACASSGQSIGGAFRLIQRGESKVVIAGGADSLSAELLLAGFSLLGALSRNVDPETASRPFDRQRDGFVPGEGAAMLILEDLEHAHDRGAKMYAEIVGYGETLSAFRITDLPPEGRGVVEAMALGMQEAGILPEQVDYINAHGTSTQLNDRVEAQAIRRVFASGGKLPLVSSTKSATGHLISAAGALELAFCALAIRDQNVPPTLHLHATDCDAEIDFVANHARRTQCKIAMSNSIGFGGSNSSLLLVAP